jgi:hypothetical protein
MASIAARNSSSSRVARSLASGSKAAPKTCSPVAAGMGTAKTAVSCSSPLLIGSTTWLAGAED